MSPVVSFVMALFVSILAGSKSITTKERVENYKSCSSANKRAGVARIGGFVDHTTRIGKERKIAMEMAIKDSMINNFASSSRRTCSQIHLHLQLHLKDSRAAATGNNSTIDKISFSRCPFVD
ncbi:hypothetical protein PanWU01x14_119970 [Parasponia andersonii]|uniref:Uncharacterized protein n=1 Tax=Parasponia andersonii TaxID=3476 RepID=A0A2P5CVK3_PARAD|nr:hypothetical protein PanWU01x14_119970 [Parasponia andersonii]